MVLDVDALVSEAAALAVLLVGMPRDHVLIVLGQLRDNISARYSKPFDVERSPGSSRRCSRQALHEKSPGRGRGFLKLVQSGRSQYLATTGPP
jgi:hypothetical protein